MTTLVHGAEAVATALKATEILFGGSLEGINAALFQDIVGEVPTKELAKDTLAAPGIAMTELIVLAGLAPSKGAARKDLEAGGIYLNNIRVADHTKLVTASDLLFGKYLLLRKGKKSYVVLKVTD